MFQEPSTSVIQVISIQNTYKATNDIDCDEQIMSEWLYWKFLLFYSIKDQDGRFFEYFSSVHVGDLGAAPSELDEADGNFNRYKQVVGGKARL